MSRARVNTNGIVRPYEDEDLAAVGRVGPAIFAASYGYLWDDAAAFAVQLESYGPEGFAAFMARPGNSAWVALLDGKIVGFLTLVLVSLEPVTKAPGGAEIPRIYLLAGAQRLGLGRKLLDVAVDTARAARRDYLWLDVMDTAPEARAAYAKWGFTEIGTRVFDAPVKAGLAGMMVGKMAL